MTGKLKFKYDFTNDPNDDCGWLTVDVVGDGFSGVGGFWVQCQDVEKFGDSLATYPISADTPIKAAWGFGMLEGDDLRLSIEIAPANGTGDLCVQTEVADYSDPRQRVRTSFLTNYPELEAFRLSVRELMGRKLEEACLLGR